MRCHGEPKLDDRLGVGECEHVLLKSLAEVGLSHEDIDVVVLPHVRFGDAGGVLSAYEEGKKLLFPRGELPRWNQSIGTMRRKEARDKNGARRPSRLQGMLLAALVTGMLVEIPGRLVLWHVEARRTALGVFPGAFGGELRDALLHDFVDPRTRVKYDYDMFLGWRARPWQRGVTYQLDADGHRTNGNTIRDDAERVFLTGGSAAWSVGASDDTQTITATMERVLNGQGRAGPGIHVMNLAEQAYGMRQEEAVVLEAYSASRGRPRCIVFLDGFNDAHTILFGRDPNRFRTYGDFPTLLRDALRQYEGPVLILSPEDMLTWSVSVRALRLITRAVSSRFVEIGTGSVGGLPTTLSVEQGVAIRAFFETRLRHLRLLFGELGVPVIFVLQPIGYVGRGEIKEEEFLRQDPLAGWWRQAYGILDDVYGEAGREGACAVSLVRLFENERAQVYLDAVHMNDRGYRRVGEALARVVGAALDSEPGGRRCGGRWGLQGGVGGSGQ
jgi:hypothetical protein